MKAYLLLGCWVLWPIAALYSQSLSLQGEILDENQNPIPGATVLILNTEYGTTADALGTFLLQIDNPGLYTLEVSSVGFQTQRTTIQLTAQSIATKVTLKESLQELDEVVVEGRLDKQTIESGGLSVEAVDLSEFRTETSDVATVLNRTAGVNIRQSAGVGSSVRVNLNGLQGKAVTFFRNGVPTDYMGSGFNVALLPANSLERVDVYKGVLPIELGSDALGGALNFVTRKNRDNRLEVSHEIASYGTHRSSLNAHYRDKKDRYVNLLGFFNYSDNDYDVDVQIRDPETRNLTDISATRFHDTFLSAFSELQLGILNRSWADELSVSGGFSLIRDDIQHSLQMRQAYGRARQLQDSFFGAVNYEKSFGKLDVSFFGAFGENTTTTIDTALQVFNWLGEVERQQGFTRGEINNGSLSWAEFTVTEWAGRTTWTYRVSDRYRLTFNNVFTRKRRVGEDSLRASIVQTEIDLLTVPASLVTNISGLEWRSMWLGNKLTHTIGLKNYYFRNAGIDFGDVFASSFDPIVNSGNLLGVNTSLKYVTGPLLLLRTSYEYAVRIPEEDEIYGDGLFLQSNPELKPERSHNLNIGFRVDKALPKSRTAVLEFNAFLRQQRDLIYTRASAFSIENVNGSKANAYGAELDMSFDLTRRLSFNGNVTFQDLRLAEAREFGEEFLVGERIPDIPYFFFNTGLRYRSKEYGRGVYFSGFLYQSFVEKYFLFFQANPATDPPTIPRRNIVRLGVSTEIRNWTFTAESNNVFDAVVFENFREQRPGRTWHLKVTFGLPFKD
ncbi:MAG: TonB-dependent receptor [Bacteroidota bacterium]